MNGRSVTVALGGLVRNFYFFLRCLEPLIALRNEGVIGRIVYAVWTGEIAKHPDVREVCRLNGIELIELAEPSIVMAGHYLHQVKAVRAVADRCGPDDFLLRTRPDMLFEDVGALRALLTHPLDLGDLGPLPAVFRNRVWIPSAILLCPFYVWDTTIFGRASDVAALFRYDVGEDVEIDPRAVRATPVEIRFAMRPFLDRFPVLKAWRRIQLTGRLVFGREERQNEAGLRRDLRIALNTPVFREILATYWLILQRYFLVGRSGYDGRALLGRDGVNRSDPMTDGSTSILMADTVGLNGIDHDRFAPNLALAPDFVYAQYLSSSDWLDRLFKGDRFGEEAAVAPFLAALGAGLGANDHRGRVAEAEALLDALYAADG